MGVTLWEIHTLKLNCLEIDWESELVFMENGKTKEEAITKLLGLPDFEGRVVANVVDTNIEIL